MKKEKNDSKVVRINYICQKRFLEMGNGNMQKGIEKSLKICDMVKKNPEDICMQHIESFMNEMNRYYSDNHKEHFSNFPAFVLMGLKRGSLDPSILNVDKEGKK